MKGTIPTQRCSLPRYGPVWHGTASRWKAPYPHRDVPSPCVTWYCIMMSAPYLHQDVPSPCVTWYCIMMSAPYLHQDVPSSCVAQCGMVNYQVRNDETLLSPTATIANCFSGDCYKCFTYLFSAPLSEMFHKGFQSVINKCLANLVW